MKYFNFILEYYYHSRAFGILSSFLLDFTLTDTELFFTSGSSLVCGNIQAEDDGIFEVDETLEILLSTSNERVVVPISPATVIIVDAVSQCPISEFFNLQSLFSSPLDCDYP